MCDSISELIKDKNGKENWSKPMWVCDTSSIVDNMHALEFYEKWSTDDGSCAISKETLGFAVMSTWNKTRSPKASFYIFKNKAAYEIVKEKLAEQQK